MLAAEVGLSSREQVFRLLRGLRKLKLVDWTPTKGGMNIYRVLPLPVTFLQHPPETFPSQDTCDISATQPIRSSSRRKNKKPSPPPTPSPEGDGVQRKQPAAASKSRAEKPTANSKADDDDRLTPEERFLKRLRERHGAAFDAKPLLRMVKQELGESALSLADFIAYDHIHTTGAVTNPGGYYRDLTRRLVKDARMDARDAVREQIRAAATNGAPEPPKDATGRCTVCRFGKIGTAYCTCELGRDLERVDKRPPKSESAAAKKGAA